MSVPAVTPFTVPEVPIVALPLVKLHVPADTVSIIVTGAEKQTVSGPVTIPGFGEVMIVKSFVAIAVPHTFV